MDCGIPFCHNGCPLGNLIPEWNDLGRRGALARGDRAAARDQQLPGVHRPALPGAVRSGLRARHRRRPGHHQAGRGRRSSTGPGTRAWSTPVLADGADRQAGRRRRQRSGRARRRPAADPGRPRGHRLRARRPHRRPAALRHPGIQDGEGGARTAGSRRWRPRAPASSPAQRRRRPVASTSCATSYDAIVLAGGSTAGRDLPVPGRELDGHPPGDGVPRAVQPGAGGRPREPPIVADRQARRDHRRRRHRRGLPRHRAPAGRAHRRPAGDHAAAAGHAGRHRPRGRPGR